MNQRGNRVYSLVSFLLLVFLTSCTYNPLSENNHLTGSPAAIAGGAAAGASIATALGVSSKSNLLLAGIGGAGVGYYLTTLRFASAGIIQANGQVYQVGEYVTIEIPSDALFEPNTDDFLPSADPALKSAATILNRYPHHNIMVSGNTAGFGANRWEQKLSENRARQVASYLWTQGIQQTSSQSLQTRQLSYVGYGSYFPIANTLNNDSIQSNNRIQITAYPTAEQLLIAKKAKAFRKNCGGNEPQFYTLEHWKQISPSRDIITELPVTGSSSGETIVMG